MNGLKNFFPDDSLVNPTITFCLNTIVVLVVRHNFDKTLVCQAWGRDVSWKIRKRPFADKFLRNTIKQGYEVVIWSSGLETEIEANVNAFLEMPESCIWST